MTDIPPGVYPVGQCNCGGLGAGMHRIACVQGLVVPNAMVDPGDFVFHPEDRDEAVHLRLEHSAVPLHPDLWPFGELPTKPCAAVPCPPFKTLPPTSSGVR